MDENLPAEIAELQSRLQESGHGFVTIATAESATAGRIADRLTDVAGASAYFLGGVVAYSNEAKNHLLNVRRSTLRRHGAVSHEVACEMAAGGRKALTATICIADTGIAGPGGGSAAKPVGLFYLGLATPGDVRAFRHVFNGSRNANKDAAVHAALLLVREYLLQCCALEGARINGSI